MVYSGAKNIPSRTCYILQHECCSISATLLGTKIKYRMLHCSPSIQKQPINAIEFSRGQPSALLQFF